MLEHLLKDKHHCDWHVARQQQLESVLGYLLVHCLYSRKLAKDIVQARNIKLCQTANVTSMDPMILESEIVKFFIEKNLNCVSVLLERQSHSNLGVHLLIFCTVCNWFVSLLRVTSKYLEQMMLGCLVL